MRAKKKYYFILPRRLNILFHSLSHSVPLFLSLSQSLNSYPLPRLSQALILSQSLSSLTVTLSISLIHHHQPNPTVPSRISPHHHSLKLPHSSLPAQPSRPKPSIASNPCHRANSLTLCLFVIGDFFYFVCDWWFCLVWVEEKNWRFVVVVNGKCGYGWCYGCFLGSGINYFIVVVILFYCDIYIILLCWKLK